MEPLAITGFAFNLPQGASDDAALWNVLELGKNLSSEWPANRGSAEAFRGSTVNSMHRGTVTKGHFLKQDPAAFDAPFFSIPAHEAAAMDPQQRWMLETAYHAFENAGLRFEDVRGSPTAVFTASMADDYTRLNAKDPERMPRTAITGTTPSMLANKISWFFNLTGPSMHVDSACSSSMTALHLACQSVQNGDASQALVMGSSVILSPESTMLLSNMNFLSPDGVSHSFDSRANGYARGEGVVALVIKPVSLALNHGDAIRAIIRSVGSNQDGRTPTLTQPSSKAQEILIRDVYAKAGLDFQATRYIEAHGTGTALGDPIEMQAIRNVFQTFRSEQDPLYVGSIKSNIGHLEAGSGLAGVLKSIFILEKGVIPPNALFAELNPSVESDSAWMIVPKEAVVWPTGALRRISVNSFGFGGSNSHAILDDAFHYLQERQLNGIYSDQALLLPRELPVVSNSRCINGTNGLHIPVSPPHATNGITSKEKHINKSLHSTSLLVWSAHDEGSLGRLIKQHQLRYNPLFEHDPTLQSRLAYTLGARRSLMSWRAFATLRTPGEGDASPMPMSITSVSEPIRASSHNRAAIVFTGQGAQYPGMGMDLLRFPVFKQVLQESDTALRDLGCKWSILNEISNQHNIGLPEYSQVSSTALQIALFELLESFGLVPDVVIGHSSGEIAAAYAAGALSLQSALKVAYYRGVLAGELKASSSEPKAMLAVNLPESEVGAYLKRSSITVGDGIWVACVNSPVNCTLSGSETTIDFLKNQLDADGIFAAKLNTGVAYHTPIMNHISSRYGKAIEALNLRPHKGSSPTMISTVTRQVVCVEALTTAQYWVDNLVSPVLFSEAVTVMLQYPSSTLLKPDAGMVTDLIELGPHSALRRPISDIIKAGGESKVAPRYFSALERSKAPVHTLANLIGNLFSHGYDVSVEAVNQGLSARGSCPVPFVLDGPKYPFDHSRTYWNESRLAQGFRFRQPVPSDTLGSRVQDWNPLEPCWRNVISVNSMPWIGHHILTKNIVYPGAGFIVTAVEAARQTVIPDQPISRFFIKEAHFLSPVILQNDASAEPTEIITRLRRIPNPLEKESSWAQVLIFAYHKEQWTESFRATVQVQYDDKPQLGAMMGVQNEWELERKQAVTWHDEAVRDCTRPISSKRFYSHCRENGFVYGESFKLLDDIKWDGGKVAVASINAPGSLCQTDSFLHPAILDAVFHLGLAPGSDGSTKSIGAMVPYQLFNTWFSARGWGRSLPTDLQLAARVPSIGKTRAEARIHAFASDSEPLLDIGRLVFAAVSDVESSRDKRRDQRLIHRIEWLPQLSLMSPEQLAGFCHAGQAQHDAKPMPDFTQKLEIALVLSCRRTLAGLSPAEVKDASPDLKKFVEVTHHLIGLYENQLPSNEVAAAEIEEALSACQRDRPSWSIFPIIARRLGDILRGRTNALDLVFSNNLVEPLYRDTFSRVCDERLSRFLELASHENPGLRILEIGAGTGSMTRNILGSLREIEARKGTVAFREYIYTDISPSFFDKARDEFGQDRVSYQTFDVETDIAQQGFHPESYDLVLAGSVIHATRSLKMALGNVRNLLTLGGQLVLLEFTCPDNICATLGFGLLPGWWLSQEQYREHSPFISETQWDRELKQSGFSGADLILRDDPITMHAVCSIITSTALRLSPTHTSIHSPTSTHSVALVFNSAVPSQTTLASSLQSIFSTSHMVDIHHLDVTPVIETSVTIALFEVGAPFLANLSARGFEQIQKLLQVAQKLVWVSSSLQSEDSLPFYHLATGLLRVVRAEMPEKRIVLLADETKGEETDIETLHCSILEILETYVFGDNPEVELIIRDGLLCSGRLIEDIDLDERINAMTHPSRSFSCLNDGPSLKLDVGTHGMLDSLRLVEDIETCPSPGAGEAEVEIKAWGINFHDVFLALGRLEDESLGFDCAGVVTRSGLGCEFKPGDRVGLGVPDSMRTHITTASRNMFRIPGSVTFEEAASFGVPACTAYHCLIDVARLQRNEKVLIHSAAGSTGQMAIWIAKHCGAEIFATVGNEEKKRLLIDKFDIPPSHILYSRDVSFAHGIERLTRGKGVDVVLNSLSGDRLTASWSCMAQYGRFVEIGKADISANSPLPMARFHQNVSFFAVDLYHIALTKPNLISKLYKNVISLFDRGVMQYPSPRHRFSVSQVEQAFRLMQSGNNVGRVIITLDAQEVVPKFLIRRPQWTLNPDASYLIVGGLGGIGRAIAKWMAGKGARHLILPSRSGPASQTASQIVQELVDAGVQVATPICDVSSKESVSEMLTQYASTMPRIKGCINSAMDLQDSMFESMNFKQWGLTIRSKVNTSWNLHDMMPHDLDFFILLSSVAGIYGSITQANYAAGCTFQDALARYMVSQGRNAVSLDVGWMRTIGIIAERDDYTVNREKARDMVPVESDELMSLLDLYCDPARVGEHRAIEGRDQVLIGATTPSMFLRRGEEPVPQVRGRLFSGFRLSQTVAPSKTDDEDESKKHAWAFRQAKDRRSQCNAAKQALTAKLARVLSISADEVNTTKTLTDYGVDSLMAVELRKWFGNDFGVKVAVFDFMGNHQTIDAVTEMLVGRSELHGVEA
ncbi:hypothetical protein F4803DRAFT_538775 [Xylaria telfairii]|nr:hypothetical protein F4803DRAFT_538775 [Xylaria telfairii]